MFLLYYLRDEWWVVGGGYFVMGLLEEEKWRGREEGYPPLPLIPFHSPQKSKKDPKKNNRNLSFSV